MRGAVLLLMLASCAAPAPREPTATGTTQGDAGPLVADGVETVAPRPDPEADPDFSDLCPFADAGLASVARRFARDAVEGRPAPDADAVGVALREAGVPYAWPRAWSLSGQGDLTTEARSRLGAWLGAFAQGGQRRCGIVRERRGNTSAVAAVAVDALADLEPLPGRVRPGSWITLNARLLAPAQGAKVVVLGPRGAPRPVPTSLDAGEVRARFALDAEGPWIVQLLAELAGGPRPVLEALILAGNQARQGALHGAAPGEEAAGSGSPSAQLAAMVAKARRDESLPPLTLDPELERLATQHAEAQRAARRVAHDLGDGDPEARVAAAGLALGLVAENVAHSDRLALAHRALWRSPSHRANILHAQVDVIGVGVAEDADGGVWVCELFGRRRR